jgi:predicted nucleic acid-binding protein
LSAVVDTNVWTLLVRRRAASLKAADAAAVAELRRLGGESRAILIGAVRQEVLSGIRHAEQFERIRRSLRGFDDTPSLARDHERAAEFFNTCRSAGVQGSPTDFLICAVSERVGIPIFTLDRDFEAFARQLPIRLHQY